MEPYPKVIIFGQPFNNHTGGGITLTNLFKGWPKEKIAVAYPGHGLSNVTTNVCDTFYQLGSDEYKWIFPFNLIQRSFPSGIKRFREKKEITVTRHKLGPRYIIVNNYFYPLLRWTGIYHIATKIRLSEKFKVGVVSLAAVSYCPLLPENRQISNPDNPLHQQK